MILGCQINGSGRRKHSQLTSVIKLADLCSVDEEELINDARFVDEMGTLLMRSKTSSKLGSFVTNFRRQYINARRNVKRRIQESAKLKTEKPNLKMLKTRDVENESGDVNTDAQDIGTYAKEYAEVEHRNIFEFLNEL